MDLVESNERSVHQKFDTLQKELNAFRNTLDQIKDLQQSLASVKQKLDEKASYQNLRNLEFQMEEYVKQVQFQDLISTLTNKADNTDFIIVTQQQNLIQSQLQLIKHSNEDNSEKVRNLSASIKEQINLVSVNIKEMEEGIKKTTYDTNAKIIQSKEVQRQYIKEQELKDQAKTQERDEWEFKQNRKFEKINDSIEGLATKDQLMKLKVEILPAIKEQSSKMNIFSTDNEQMKEMIRRFDEVISEKASKMSIHELEIQLEKQYVKMKTWNALQSQVSKSLEMQQENVVKMQDSVKNFEQNMSEEITMAVKKNLTKTMANYEKVLNQFSKFFDQEELNKILERKVDLDYVQSMGDIKANKIDVESCVSLIESVHERIKHIAILQVELAKVLIPVKNTSHFQATETKNSKINRRDFLYRQAQLTSSWIGEFTVRQTYPDEEEHIHSLRSQRNGEEQVKNGKQVKIMKKNIAFSDVPSPIRAFEKYHSQQIQDKTKQDLPQTLKRWKQKLTQKNQSQMQDSINPYSQMSVTQSNFYNLKQQPSIQLEDFLKERQSLYQNQKISDQFNQKKVRKSYRSVRVSLNSSPHNQYNYSSNQTIGDKGINSVSITARDSINQSHRQIQIGGQDISQEEKQKHQNDQTQEQTFLSTIMNEQSIANNPSLKNFNYGLDGPIKKMPPLQNIQKRVTIFNNNHPSNKMSNRSQDQSMEQTRNLEEQRQMILQNSALINVNQIKVQSRGISSNPRTESYNPQQQR